EPREATEVNLLRRHAKKLAALGAVLLAPLVAHAVVGRVTRLEPPSIDVPRFEISEAGGVRRAGRAWTTVRGGVRVVRLAGSPEEIGAQHARLLYDRMVDNEGVVWSGFRELVPFAPARTLLFDIGRVRHRHV